MMGYVTLVTTYEEGADAKTIKFSYIIKDIILYYNIILGRPTINALGAVVSTRCLTLIYSLLDIIAETIQGD